MENKTKIVLLEAKELIYTAIFVVLGILLLVVCINMFASKKEKKTPAHATATYNPGTYTAAVSLGESNVDVNVVVSSNKIKSVSFNTKDETVKTMYPLLDNALTQVNNQIKETGTIDQIAFETDYQYTGTVVKQAIEAALEKAKVK